MSRKLLLISIALLTANVLTAMDLYSQTGQEQSFNLGLRSLLVKDKYYPAFEIDGYLKYAGLGLHVGWIYSEKPFEEFDNKKYLGFFWGINVFTKLTVANSKTLRLVPGFEFAQHRLTSIDDNVSYHLSSLYLSLEYILFKRIRLEYALMFPVYRSSEIKINKSGVISLLRIHYFLIGN